MKSQALKGYIMILLSAIGFGSYGAWSRLVGADFGVFSQGWVRSLLVLVILIPIAIFTKSFKPVQKSDIKWILLPVVFGIFTQAPIFYAWTHIDIGTATLIFYAIFLITSYGVGKLLFGERITLPKIISLLLACVGLVCIFGFSLARFSLLALMLAVINGVASGGEVSTTKKPSKKFSSLQVGIYIWGGIFITHLLMAFLTHDRLVPPTLKIPWLAMGAFAIVGLVSFWLVVEGFKYVDASIGGLLGLLEIISSVIFGIIFFHELLTTYVLLGGGLILFAAMLPDLVSLFSKSRVKSVTATEPII